MKKLKVVTSYAQVVGFILSYSMEEFYLDQYAYNAYGEYTRFCLYAWNDPNDEEDVFNQPDLASRIKRLHYYFPKAEYISEEVIEHLNFEKEDIKTALKDVVEFWVIIGKQFFNRRFSLEKTCLGLFFSGKLYYIYIKNMKKYRKKFMIW